MNDSVDGRIARWIPAVLGLVAVLALFAALAVRGGTALWFLVLFALFLPAALAAALIRWWPWGPRQVDAEQGIDWRRNLTLGGAGLLLAAVLTLMLGIAWTGGRLGNLLLVAGTLLLPPAAITAAAGWLIGRSGLLERELSASEQFEYRAREHWGVFLPPIGVLSLAALFAAGPFGVIGYSAAGVLYLLVLPATAVGALGAYLNTELALTATDLLIARGVFRRRIERLARDRIDACGVRRSWLGRILGFGRLSVICSDGRSFAIGGIRDPEALRVRLAPAAGTA